ncbi:uncharacterized protein J4E87_004006 [Alternaria ethzedia]|uniref:uncharacterized protein n=1 Tax=Alternaria viburni TaxID=566460 RepID=UPI0020C2A4DD|nr:uncharacterized protein J4E79_003227 [Alternaria viburni]XP_049234615.1 uncharacterized protein J4E87_004006 [Alternaria ethzedia]XP_051325763.1 uncharacterized protein J4E85_006034 [Alternaria conjuncta]KAI4627443.1 hypothetical protein J4E87_004006 [Alternaria ethzedia]KAI4664928.1 hypothetical protein J4E79_003227 [Alternaria viburni]KAI4927523.1 hypothetical protein J4E85_006034 [Alternaria conjuncta]
MSGTNTSFFSFGLDDSFISKSFAGLNYRNLPASLQDLLLGRTVSEVHWAALGPAPDSWILSSKDSSGKDSLRWGPAIPARLQSILNKTWHSPHLRAFLGPDDSFIIWHPELIRWANLPTPLEDALQSWLTPSGWRCGPPRIVTWGPEGAFFAMSEYGDVVYRLGDANAWEIYKETVEEWKAEKGFVWTDLAFITLDPTSVDQFIAIRNDGTWAGSIDDINEEALETFALNFFARAKKKTKPSTSQSNGQMPNGATNSTEAKPDAATQVLYEKWSTEAAVMFAAASAAAGGAKPKAPRKLQVRSQSSSSDVARPPLQRMPSASPKLLSMFPYLPNTVTTCNLTACSILKSEPESIHACQHDVEKLLRASGLYSYEWLRQERLRWHPDRFARLCEEEWRETGKKLAGEMFKLMSVLIEDLKSRTGEGS